jgi:hypothetical protein
MPPRTTPFQAIVHLVRQHYATPGVAVTESKWMFDPTANKNREVDIVIEGEIGRRADRHLDGGQPARAQGDG